MLLMTPGGFIPTQHREYYDAEQPGPSRLTYFVCNICDKHFTSFSSLEDHVCHRKRKADDLPSSQLLSNTNDLVNDVYNSLNFTLEEYGRFRFCLKSTVTFSKHGVYNTYTTTQPFQSYWVNYLRNSKTKVENVVQDHLDIIATAPNVHHGKDACDVDVKVDISKCEILLQRYSKKTRSVSCTKCQQTIRHDCLKNHVTQCIGPGRFCDICDTTLIDATEEDLNEHIMLCGVVSYMCRGGCDQKFSTAANRASHENTCKTTTISVSTPAANPPNTRTAINGNFKIIKISPISQDWDYESVLDVEKQRLKNILETQLQHLKSIKLYLTLNVVGRKYVDGEEKVLNFRTCAKTLLRSDDINKAIDDHIEKLFEKIDNYTRNGSGWMIEKVQNIHINITKYAPFFGGSYLRLPKDLTARRSLLNIKNEDEKCLMWCCLAAKYPAPRNLNAARTSSYAEYQNEIDDEGITWPIELKDLKKFEEKNGFMINVVGVEEVERENKATGAKFKATELFPLYVSSSEDPNAVEVNVLLISNETTQHFVLIKSLSGLLSKKSTHRQKYYCIRCFHGFVKEENLLKHREDCIKFKIQVTQCPHEDYLRFTSFRKTIRHPLYIVADFECVLKDCDDSEDTSATCKEKLHIPCGFSYKVISDYEEYEKDVYTFRAANPDENVSDVFILRLHEEYESAKQLLETDEPMRALTEEQLKEFNEAQTCYLCEDLLNNDKVKDHCHYTGKYIGAAHNSCNLERRTDKRIPVVIHNLKNYDCHLFIKELYAHEDDAEKVHIIPRTMEKYVSVQTPKFRFIDSYQHLNTSLDTLVNNLTRNGQSLNELYHLRAHTAQKYGVGLRKLKLLSRKGVYPYTYMDSLAKFDEEELPSQQSFYNDLTDEPISDEDYAHVQSVWEEFELQNLGELHDLYVEGDVLLLADVFQKYRKLCLTTYGIDPLHYCTLPGLTLDACLKMTKVKLEYLKDIEMFLMVEKAIRGGISVISKRFSEANHEGLQTFDETKEKQHLLYIDANNLYGKAMVQKMPIDGFKWIKNDELKLIDDKFIFKYDNDKSDTGYILEVDVEIPQSIHQSTNDYPLFPEPYTITENDISSKSKEIRRLRGGKETFSSTKLAPNMHPKIKYVVHIRNLKFYLEKGAVLRKVHRVISFRQTAWIEQYIMENTRQRQQATDRFEKDFFKLLNNAFFGKTMESVRKRIRVVLIDSARAHTWQTSKPGFKRFTIFDDNLVGIELVKPKVILDKPIYVGFSVLELSKLHMFEFHYDVMKKKYPLDKSVLCFTDTDSFLYEIKSTDIYHDLGEMAEHFDFSNYPIGHPLHSTVNQAVIGKFKDECESKPIKQFIGLRSKMYSIMIDDGKQKSTAAGVKKHVAKRELKHHLYRLALDGFAFRRDSNIRHPDLMIKQRTFRSYCHNIITIQQNRVGLTSYDDKRFILNDNHMTRAHGHYLNLT